MNYKYKFEIDGQKVDISDNRISKLVTTMLLNLYKNNKNNEKIFFKQ